VGGESRRVDPQEWKNDRETRESLLIKQKQEMLIRARKYAHRHLLGFLQVPPVLMLCFITIIIGVCRKFLESSQNQK
jgi:hypothetical protein